MQLYKHPSIKANQDQKDYYIFQNTSCQQTIHFEDCKRIERNLFSKTSEIAPTSWQIKRLIEVLVTNKKPINIRNGKYQSEDMLQELTNEIVGKIALKPLEGDAKRYCQLGHDLEKTYTQQLIIDCQNSLFSFGDIEQISEVGLVEKVDKNMSKIPLIDWLDTYLKTKWMKRFCYVK